MKFAEFEPGQRLQAGPHVLDEAALLQFARAYDPQWFHVDPQAAERGPHQGLIASGWHTCAIAMRLAVDAFLADSESYASPGLAYLRWPHPVRAGDELNLQATVLEVRRSIKRAEIGMLRWRWQLFNGRGNEVLDLEATSLFRLDRPAA